MRTTNEKISILYVDDERENLTVFKFSFMQFYKIYLANSGEEGLDILKDNPEISLIICDQRMPKMSGVEFFEKTIENYPDCIRVIVTGFSDIDTVIESINKGKIYHFVKKPWNKDEFKLILDKAYETYQLRKANKFLIQNLQEANQQLENYALELEEKVNERTTEIAQQNEEIREINEYLQRQQEVILQSNEEITTQRDELVEKNIELEQHHKHLEDLVKERTIDLETAKNKAEESNHLKTAFLANMSHEIRTPLNAIVGFSALMSSPNLSTLQKETYYSYIESSSKSLLQLIEDILDISRIEAKQMPINKTRFEIKPILYELHDIFTDRLYEEKNKSVQLIIEEKSIEDTIWITADAIRFRQIFSNLISNAIKYTENGSIVFGYEFANNQYTDSTLPEIVFFVKDTGIGIAEEYYEFIFEHFNKIESKDTKLYRGAGLGLSISKNLVQLMGGRIWIESEIDKGSTFYFSLPYKEMSIQVEEKPEIPEKEKYDWQDKVILVAEDENSNYMLISSLVEKTGAKLIWAKNGLEAIDAVKYYNEINLILMDIKMPLMSGYQAVPRIKALKTIPIIAQTAHAMPSDIQQILDCGCDDYITKPYQRKLLLKKINEWI